MPYKADWSITLVGKGKVFPVGDDDSIEKLFAGYIADLISKGQIVDLEETHIHKSKLEQY